jgi:hypothetical protein
LEVPSQEEEKHRRPMMYSKANVVLLCLAVSSFDRTIDCGRRRIEARSVISKFSHFVVGREHFTGLFLVERGATSLWTSLAGALQERHPDVPARLRGRHPRLRDGFPRERTSAKDTATAHAPDLEAVPTLAKQASGCCRSSKCAFL